MDDANAPSNVIPVAIEKRILKKNSPATLTTNEAIKANSKHDISLLNRNEAIKPARLMQHKIDIAIIEIKL